MRPRLLILFVVLTLVPLSVSFAEEKNLTGEVSVTGVLPYIDGNKATFNEYRDYKSNVISPFAGLLLNYDNKKGYFFDFNASDIGYQTQEYLLEGGKYGSFKYRLFYNELPHNVTWDARTFYTTPGDSTLTYPQAIFPNQDPNQWGGFDYKTLRKTYGGGVDFTVVKPFFASFDGGRQTKEGTSYKQGGAEGGEGARATFGLATELPEPINYTTDYLKAEIGYGKQPFFGALSYYYQKFSNDDPYLFVRNPFFTVPGSFMEQIPLPPSNNYQQAAFAGNMKLPWNSKANVKLAYSMAESSKHLVTSIFEGSTTPVPITYSDNTFNGKLDTQNYQFVLTSAPFRFVDGKLYYQYYKTNNKSDEISIDDGSNPLWHNHLFEYEKQNYGAELDWRLMKGLHLMTAYGHNYIDRKREDIPKNNDDIYRAEVKFTGIDIATLKVGYQYMVRAADHDIPTLTLGTQQEADIIEQFVRRYDAAAKNQYAWKVDLQLYPVENLNFNIMYKYIRNDYKDTTLGITNDKRNFWGVSGDYAWTKWFKTYGYFDWDQEDWEQEERRYNPASAPPSNPNPVAGPQNSTNFNWTVDQRDKNYDWGVGADIYAIPKKLTVRVGYDYVRSNGNADFTYLTSAALTTSGGVTRTNENMDISNWDDYRKECFFIKFIYAVTPALTFTTGYAYESYKYNDAQFDGYRYVMPAGATGAAVNTYLTGAYADSSYKANIVFFGAAYKF